MNTLAPHSTRLKLSRSKTERNYFHFSDSKGIISMDEMRNNTISQEVFLDEITYGEKFCQVLASDYLDLIREGIELNGRI